MDEVKKWRKGKAKAGLPDFIKLHGRVYCIDDAISLGKITVDCEPATKQEYKEYINRNKPN